MNVAFTIRASSGFQNRNVITYLSQQGFFVLSLGIKDKCFDTLLSLFMYQQDVCRIRGNRW